MAAVHTIPKPRMRRVLVCLMAVILSFTVLSMAASAVVFGVIFSREDRPSGPAELRYSDVDPEKYPRRSIKFLSGDNTLQGYVYPAPSPRGLVVVAGGIRSDADRHLPEIEYFVDHGWSALAFSGTGVHDSQGGGLRGLPQTKLDLLSALEYVRSDPALLDLPVVIYGHSVGGYGAVAALEDAPQVAAVVCIAGFDSPTRTMRYQARQYVGVLADVEYPFMCLHNWLLFGADADCSALEVLREVDTPVAIFEGSGDTVVPAELGLEQYREEFVNPNVTAAVISAPYRNRHSTIWLSQDAAKYLLEAQAQGGEMDRLRANQLDGEFMETVMDFFEAALDAPSGGVSG